MIVSLFAGLGGDFTGFSRDPCDQAQANQNISQMQRRREEIASSAGVRKIVDIPAKFLNIHIVVYSITDSH